MKSGISLKGAVALTLIISAASLFAGPPNPWKSELTGREISYIFRCALLKEDPSWMWANDGETIRVGAHEFGHLLGAAQHIRYSALPTCITHYAILDYPSEERDYFHGLSALSGIPIFQERQGSQIYSNEINYYNPTLISWIKDNMIPDPNTPLTLEANFQKLYDIVAKRNARILAYTLVELKRSGDFKKHYEKYLELNGQGRVDMKHTILLDSPLQDVYSAEQNDPYGYNFGPGHAATFWFRREMDGTTEDVMELLKAVFQRYDQEALGQL